MNESGDTKAKLKRAALAVLYFPLATAMYYFSEEFIHLGIDILYKMIFAAVIVVLSFSIFMTETDLAKAKILLKYIMLLILPHIVVLTVSMPLWVFNMSPLSVVRRGAFAQGYCIAIILAGAGMLYVFGKDGLWLNLASMLAANLVTVIQIIRSSGFGEYCRELKTLVLTFGGEVGPSVASAEINELTFALGLYLLYLILNGREIWKEKVFAPMLILTVFCYFSGFKRIGAFALALCILAKLVLTLLIRGKPGRGAWLLLFSAAVIFAAFGYICLVRAGIFDFLEERFQINTMGRRALSAFIEKYYSIGPDYFGQGAGFVSRLFSDLEGDRYTVRALHNDVLVIYIDIGFWGFWLWMFAFFPLRVWLSAKWQGIRGGILCFCYCLFIIVTALTDNTIYYVYVIGAAAVLTMGYQFDAQIGKRDGAI